MGTSNWQNIPFCVDALMKIAPERVIDIGVGFGRWGVIIREFCDVWYGRVFQRDWQVHIEGIEGFAGNITEYHDQFYNKIHIGDARQILPDLLKSRWDVVVFGDVLEHFSKEDATTLLSASLTNSAYVLVNIPLGEGWPQADIYENPYERHLSVWDADEFEQFYLRRSAFFVDFMNRPFGSFILSKTDPKDLVTSLFSASTNVNTSSLGNSLTPIEQDLLTQAAQNAQELARIKGTLTWQAYEAIDRSPLGQPLRQFMKMVGAPVRHKLSQRKRINSLQQINPVPILQEEERELAEMRQTNGFVPLKSTASKSNIVFSIEEKTWLAEVNQAKPEAIAILHPDWRGIRSSTLALFSAHRFVDDTLNETEAARLAHLLAETGCTRIVFSGFPLSYEYLVNAIHKLNPQIKLFVLWHGNFLQSSEDVAWQGFRNIYELEKAGLIHKWGFVKKGMAEIVAKLGLKTGFVMNYIEKISEGPSIPMAGGPHLGVWGVEYNWRKLPYAMLASTLLIPGAKVYSSATYNRVQEFGQLMNINWGRMSNDLIPQSTMLDTLAKMHLNIYVTLSECTPMLPLESLAVGVPCLLSATSHLFEDHTYLRERLVVSYHEHAEIIADYACRAIAERDQIVEAYRDYAPGYNARAQASVAKFLEL